ncbi:MAG TPA: hypothetical protein VK973_04120 [Arenicellales bacterium]|nr:hypothetical protein [Arenicellales bacterium]
MPRRRSPEQIQSEIARLEAYCNELADAIDDFEHNARRCRERLERSGGAPRQIERELERLSANRELNRRELMRTRQRIEQLQAGLAD